MAQLRVGTSGWVYPHWREVFYPSTLPASGQLAFYAQRFDTVEINSSYYRLPPRATFEAWQTQVPDDFLFAVKASRYMTHLKKLKEPADPLQRLMDAAQGLGAKLGPVLFQLPGTWHANRERLEGLLEALQAYPEQRAALEVRHASWLEPDILTLLERAGVALCLPIGWGIPLQIQLTASWTYIRFHGGQHGVGFSDAELSDWASRIQDFLSQGVDVYAYFNNDPDGHAIHDAERLLELIHQG